MRYGVVVNYNTIELAHSITCELAAGLNTLFAEGERAMSNSKLNLNSDVLFVRAKNTHYMVSTFAAVLYALVWMLSNGVHAENAVVSSARTVLEPIYVTANAPARLAPIVVVGTRDASMTVETLEAIVVTGKQDAERVAVNGYGSPITAATSARVGYIAKVRSWVRSALAKVSG
jgi:hypothetical protein